MTNPNDPWGQRPGGSPTERLPGESGVGQPSHTAEYTEAYGAGAPSEYPVTEQFGWSAPPPNATREFPPYDSQWGAYESGYGDQWSGTAVPPGAPPPGNAMPPGGLPPQKPRRNTGLWIALGLGVVMLIGVAGVVAGVLLGGKDSSSTSAAQTSVHPTAGGPAPGTPRTPRSGQPAPPSGLPGMPGLGDVDGGGTTMGTITANEGGTLTISSLTGSSVTVRTDADTQVISLAGTAVSDLPKGDMVLIQGDKAPDGSIQAKIIISTSLSGGGR